MTDSSTKTPYLLEMVAQRRILAASLFALSLAFFGIRLDRAFLTDHPSASAFLANAQPPAAAPFLLTSNVVDNRQRRGNRAQRPGAVPTLAQIFANPQVQPVNAVSPTATGPAPTSSALPATVAGPTDGGRLASSDFIGLPGGGSGGTSVTPGPVAPDPGPPAVPEPETWMMMALGVLIVGYAVRRQRRTNGLVNGLTPLRTTAHSA